MKKIAGLTIGLMLVSAGAALAASDVTGAVINQSNNQGAANVAIGVGNEANLGTVGIQNSQVKGAVINQSNNQGAANVAIGVGNEANMGSTVIK